MAKENLPPLTKDFKYITVSNNRFIANEDVSGLQDINHFSGFYENIYRDPFVNGNAFIFVTRPQLFLANNVAMANQYKYGKLALENMTREPKFTAFLEQELPNKLDKSLFESLILPELSTFKSNFLPMFTNQCKSFDSMDSNMETLDAFETKQGFREVLPSYKTTSEASSQLSITVTEDYNMSFTKLMDLWVTYMANITDGTFNANPQMINDGILDYMSSIYYFVLGPDGRTIKYWARYTGCWPTVVPYSRFNYSKGAYDPVELTLSFVYTIKEDMNPMILEDFNIVSLGLTQNELLELSTETVIDSFSYGALDRNPLLSLQSSPNSGADTKLAKKLDEFSKSPEDRRDPVVIYKNNSVKNKTFQLIFDKYGYESELMTDELSQYLDTESNKYSYNVYHNNYHPDTSSEYNSWAEEIIL